MVRLNIKLAGLALLGALAATASVPNAQALQFTNQFVQFELPSNWKCGLEGAEWVCQSEDQQKKRDAIIVLAAKLKGEQDTLDKYQEYLEKPRKFVGPGAKEITSQPKYANNKNLNGQVWVDSMHTESEIPNFFTRYLATVYQDIAVLVTYSVNKGKFADYQKQFDDMVTSLKVFRKPGGMNQGSPLAAANANLFANVSKPMLPGVDSGNGPVGQAQAPKKKTDDNDGMGMILLLAAGIGGFIIYKRKKAAGG